MTKNRHLKKKGNEVFAIVAIKGVQEGLSRNEKDSYDRKEVRPLIPAIPGDVPPRKGRARFERRRKHLQRKVELS